MLYTVNCPHCGQKHNVKKSSLGTVKKCQNCGRKMALPERGPLSGCVWGLLAASVLLSCLCCAGIKATSNLGKMADDAQRQPPADTASAVAAQNPAPAPPQPQRDTQPAPPTRPTQADTGGKPPSADEASLREKADAYEAARKKYEAARNENDSLRKLKLARRLEEDARQMQRAGNPKEAERLRQEVPEALRHVIKKFPGTQGAADAQALLDGEDVPDRPVPRDPPPPLLEDYFPQSKGEIVEVPTNPDGTPKDPSHAAPPAVVSAGAGGPKTVHVNGYYRKNGQYVPGYVRAAPGFGGGRRR